jgi:tRNA (pseudouridine54-N1)-methyltransferase
MRVFIVRCHVARSTPDFSLDALGEPAGRIDLACRCISSALWISRDIRRDTVVLCVLEGPKDPPKVVGFDGRHIKGLEPGERSIAAAIQKALQKGKSLGMGERADAAPGVSVAKQSFESLVRELLGKGFPIYYLQPAGEDVRHARLPAGNVAFILADHVGMPRRSEKLLARLGVAPVSLGPVELLASHCIVLVHNELDRRIAPA